MASKEGFFKGRLRRTRPADSKKIETVSIEEKRITEDQIANAKALYTSAKEIESLVYRLAEKWKLSELDFWEEIDRLCQKYGRTPEILSVRLVEELIRSYEQHWKILKVSERWDSDLWDELVQVVNRYHADPTQKMIAYKEQMTIDRSKSLTKMNAFMKSIEDQYQSIKHLEEEIAELEKKTQNARADQEAAIQVVKQEHNENVVEIITQAQEKLKQEMAEQAKLRRNALVEAQQVYSEEKRILQESFDKALKDTQDRFEQDKIELATTLESKLEAEKASLHAAHNGTMVALQTENTSLKEQLEAATANVQQQVAGIKAKLEEEIVRLTTDSETKKKAFNDHLDSVAQNHATELEEIAGRHEVDKKDLRIGYNKEIYNLKLQISDIDESNKEQIQLIEQRNGVAKRALEEGHKEATAEMRREFEDQAMRMKGKHTEREKELETRINQLLKDHKTENAKLRATIATLEADQAHEKEEMRRAFDEEKGELERQVTSELSRLRADFKAKKTQLESTHAEATSQLRNDVEAYSQALLARDDFKPMPDNEIKSKFEELAEEVKTLGRLEWREEQTVWPTHVLKRLSTNTTLLKRRILQEMIWAILHKHVFCSPFRAFGGEGEIMEKKWNDAYGTDPKFENGCYTWPQPEMEAERWRYVNVKECRTALRQPIDSEWDPRAKLKMGFRSTLEDIREEFTTSVGELVDLEKANVQLMDKISKKAASVWLEYGMQRCRIVILFGLSSLAPPIERIREAREGSFELVVVPELKRYGNSKGLELHTEATVAGCGGEIIEVSARKA